MNPKQCSAILVTRGDVPLEEVIRPLAVFGEVIVWNNEKRILDLKPFGLFMAADQAQYDVLFAQDDDCVVSDPAAILAAWRPGRIVCNMGLEYQWAYQHKRDKLLGFGSCFEKSLIRPTWERYLKRWPLDHITLREPNRIFTALNHEKLDIVDVPITHQPWAFASNRLWKQPEHSSARDESLRRVEELL